MSVRYKEFIGIAVVLLLSYWAIQFLFVEGFFPMHDDTQVVRVDQMAKALADGHVPVRWVKDLGYGYGYPIFNFYAPLPYYFGGLLGILGIDMLIATKVMMVVGILLAGVFMYLLAREFWGETGGVVSGLFYMYAPYHAVDIYVRGAVGEFWAYGFLPLMALGFYKVFQYSVENMASQVSSKFKVQSSKLIWKWIVVGALGFAGVILSHNLTALMTVPFLIIILIVFSYLAYKKRKSLIIYHSSLIILIGLGFSAFYWIPAILEIGYTNVQSQVGGGADFRDHFVCLRQLWESPWGFGGSTQGCFADGMSLKIGKLHLVAASITILFAIVTVLKKFQYNNTYHRSVFIVFSSCIGLLMSIFFMLDISQTIWEEIPVTAFIQYPWRFLVIASFSTSILAGGTVWFFHYLKIAPYASGVVLLTLLLIFNIRIFQPQTIVSKTALDYTGDYNVRWVASKTSDEYMPKEFIKPVNTFEIAERRVDGIALVKDITQEVVFVVDNMSDTSISLNIAPFPAWQVFIDNDRSTYKSTNNGIEIAVPSGSHTVRLSFTSTPVEKMANIISLVSIIGTIGGILAVQAGLMTRFRLKGKKA